MNLKINPNTLEKLDSDLNKRYLASGYRISGDIKDNKLTLYLIDDYGKHSAFMNEYFYGRIEGNHLKGDFRISNYALILLIVLLCVSVETVISALVTWNINGVFAPCVITAAEVIYYFYLKKRSKDFNRLINNYLLEICADDERENYPSR